MVDANGGLVRLQSCYYAVTGGASATCAGINPMNPEMLRRTREKIITNHLIALRPHHNPYDDGRRALKGLKGTKLQ